MNEREFKDLYKESIEDVVGFWRARAQELVVWEKLFSTVYNGDFENQKWFEDGMLNVCYNCVDRHVEKNPNKIAIIYDGDDGESILYTFKEVLDEIMKVAVFLEERGLKKGDTVAMYMTMSPHAVFVALACARLGIIHNAIFGGFSAESIALRIDDSSTKMLIVQEEVRRGGTTIDFLENTKKALEVKSIPVMVFNSVSCNEEMILKRLDGVGSSIFVWSKVMPRTARFVPCVPMMAEDPLFYLYTSGSTGKPKGLIHSTAGYLVYATITTKVCFDVRKDDVFCCTADIGWITGHTYVIYGPLSNGITTVVFGGVPMHPSHYRLFQIVEKYRVTHLYTAPTIIRTLKKHFSSVPFDNKHDLSSLRILGSVGEPINNEAYVWFSKNFCNCPIIDSYWQTETGGILASSIPGVFIGKAECAGLPFLGQEFLIASQESIQENVCEAEPYELGYILLKKPWPGIARGIIGDPIRFKMGYFLYSGFYFTGDEGYKDGDGYIWIRGRADDVINVSGHRISTAEVESAACTDIHVAEAAAVSIKDEITGLALCIFVVPKKSNAIKETIENSLKETLRKRIGKLVNPKSVYVCEAIPKTASGKIMRRVLRDILSGNSLGDLSACANAAESVDRLREIISLKD